MQNPILPPQWRLPAEWETQSATLLAWPTQSTDWADRLADIHLTYSSLIAAIRRYQPVILCVNDPRLELPRLATQSASHPLKIVHVPYNDTWLRDSGPLTVTDRSSTAWLDFRFDGWGGKFDASMDDLLVRNLGKQAEFKGLPCYRYQQILEGGAVEFDGLGTLLTTWRCLHRRYPDWSRDVYERQLRQALNIKRVLWLENGEIEGDDTDGHIDMMARFASPDCIVYQGCQDSEDIHYEPLRHMKTELEGFTTANGQPYQLLELPLPPAIFEDEERLPTSYANFIVLNGAIIMPTYRVETDDLAKRVLAQAFPNREIIGIDSRVLITQGGSLHCASMQLYP